ncbi:MAG: TolC family protein [Planctomycetes bacterium]|nr:TolC family protein [Planctomycetota bacterium]
MMFMRHQRASIGLVLTLAVVASCVQVEPRPDFERARDLVEASTGQGEIYDPYSPVLTEEEISAILADGLTLDEALRLALVNNRDLQAEFQEIGVAHADWVQSELLSSPSLDVLLSVPTDGGRSMLEAIVGVELLQLWCIPLRGKAAQQDLEATVLRIARRAGERLAESREAYYVAVAAEEIHRVAEENVELAARSFEAVRSLHEAGAADAFDENLARGPLLAAQLTLRTARSEATNAKRDLAKVLSVDRPADGLALTDRLPQPARTQLDPEGLVEHALSSRLDLRAIATAINAMEARMRLEQRKAWGDVAAGATIERAPGSGDPLVGPSLSVTLPMFDQNQAQVARAGFKLEQMSKLQEAAQVAVAQNVRSSADRVNTAASNLAFYSEELLPQAERSLELARESYSAGRTTLLALVEVQRQLLEARRGHVRLRLEAAVSSSELERVVGAVLPGLRP